MIYITGDKHGWYQDVEKFCTRFQTSKSDLMIVLGDNGVNYYGRQKDRRMKKRLQKLPITFMMIRGNHDMRPDPNEYLPQQIEAAEYGGLFLVDPQFPSLLFTKQFGRYRLMDKTAFVIGGAYSADKHYRLDMYDQGHHQYRWFRDEQLTAEEMKMAEADMMSAPVDLILSHTCPFRYIPRDMFLSSIDQSTVDDTMEHWLDEVFDAVPHDKWFCGHWHTDRIIDKMHFMYTSFMSLEWI